MRSFRTTCVALLLIGAVAAPAAAAKRAAYDQAVGEVLAAHFIKDRCSGLATVGGSDYQSYVLTATELTAVQGLRRQKMRKFLFYGRSDWLKGQVRKVLDDRNVEISNKKSLCAFGRGVAGTEDAIGRFLVKE
ncbi:hypothetical protein [Ruegeria arenilitoris]|uniref:hypothetical protein n=1 Tax=Ruegeria arenilitoris TaxID=1173585 RepID=UPI001C2B89A5|nr:hypothetical protein [Ruegeria arenilitoris]